MKSKDRISHVMVGALIAIVVAALIGAPIMNAMAGGLSAAIGSPESPALEQNETMANFYNGHVVYSEYEQGYFIGSPNGVPALGITPTISPTSDNKTLDTLYVLVPWWGPSSEPYLPAYDPSAYNITLDCAPANQTVTCFDHPLNIYVPGLGVVPLPGHDHLIGSVDNYQDIWWNVDVVLVFNQTAFPQTVYSTAGITSVSALIQAESMGMASMPIPTNIFLDFRVLPPMNT
ncbi:MAG: hypothetical protein KIY12_00160 [Thermoplasmata archaeon]|uniref:Uncharacterized protein n=1 Tax=Candidatus Sysuiplasma superficiale TaxID=2823368 RepID=A0A8J8CF81_9ARCH|nr:hypothetical protein [Candidatus Sysuiplasma superficiale]